MAVNLSPVGGVAAQFFDNNGVMLTGGKIYTYAAGTTTPQTTYTSNSGLTAHSNPIILDASGRVPSGEIWLTENLIYKFSIKDANDVLIGTYDNISGISTITLPLSSSNVTYTPAGTGAVTTTVQAKLRQTVSVKDFGAVGDGVTDDTAALQAACNFALASSANFDTVTINFPTGTYAYTTSPNWAISRLEMNCSSGTVFKHTGTGIALDFDGGATGGGIYVVKLTGSPLIIGNAATTFGVRTRAVHHSYFDFRVRNVTNSALLTKWAVCNEYRVRCSPIGEPAFSVVPIAGMTLEQRGVGELTSACTFHNPVIGGVSGYGIVLNEAIENTFIGGTSESNAGGVFIETTSSNNTFVNIDCEFNISLDLFVKGSYNTFINTLSDLECNFENTGVGNLVIGGLFNEITNAGTQNEFHRLTYNTTGTGSFTDTGASTVKISVRNATGGALDPDLQSNPKVSVFVNASSGNNLTVANDNIISAGSANDIAFFKFGTGKVKFSAAGGAVPIQYSSTGVAFQGTSPIAKPTVSGAKGGNAALSSLITALANYGLIIDSTT
jgi:hypothetical protein